MGVPPQQNWPQQNWFGLSYVAVPPDRPETIRAPPRTPSTPQSPSFSAAEKDFWTPDVVPAERQGKVAVPLSSPSNMHPSRRHSVGPVHQVPVGSAVMRASRSARPAVATWVTPLDESSWVGVQSPVQPPTPSSPLARKPPFTKATQPARVALAVDVPSEQNPANYGAAGWSAAVPSQRVPATPPRFSSASFSRARSVPSAPKKEETVGDLSSLLAAFGGFYQELLQGTRCTMPDSVVINDRSAEIDLSHEFPPERREAQIDPQAAFTADATTFFCCNICEAADANAY
eukprot:CAMPEP_0197626440 /NCGR_PEP_ID=MMETSP1338-20131121/5411_1 /TAXON_ID=43686 ORGANISM="Pelagodinium beii, Strain RCC1491" /NCGR_SAMPLE_ID=MMETSP1338 /ASSEMBLY_ACC=CAM_ASM_000754 /LENGTH=287 /DNA_ID=CAMNT_0043196981 /DNA_START=40 /DNA_END=902 /DNA_ORIENTATION=-